MSIISGLFVREKLNWPYHFLLNFSIGDSWYAYSAKIFNQRWWSAIPYFSFCQTYSLFLPSSFQSTVPLPDDIPATLESAHAVGLRFVWRTRSILLMSQVKPYLLGPGKDVFLVFLMDSFLCCNVWLRVRVMVALVSFLEVVFWKLFDFGLTYISESVFRL